MRTERAKAATTKHYPDIPYIGKLLFNTNISPNIYHAYYSLLPQAERKDNAPFSPCIFGAYPLTLDWQMLGLHIDRKTPPYDQIKAEEIDRALMEYAEGFKEGYYNFENDKIHNRLFKDEALKAQIVFDEATSWLMTGRGFPISYGNDRGYFDEWRQAGKEGGYFYRAWYLILENHSIFAPLFDRTPIEQKFTYCSDNSIEFQGKKIFFPFDCYDFAANISSLREAITKADVSAVMLMEYPDILFDNHNFKGHYPLVGFIYNIVKDCITEAKKLHRGTKDKLFDSFLEGCLKWVYSYRKPNDNDKYSTDRESTNDPVSKSESYIAEFFSFYNYLNQFESDGIFFEFYKDIEYEITEEHVRQSIEAGMLTAEEAKDERFQPGKRTKSEMDRNIDPNMVKRFYYKRWEAEMPCFNESEFIGRELAYLESYGQKLRNECKERYYPMRKCLQERLRQLEDLHRTAEMPANGIPASTVEETENDYELSTIHEYLEPFREKMKESEYNNLAESLRTYFKTGKFPNINTISVSKVNIKAFGWALNGIYRALKQGNLAIEYLKFAKDNISTFKNVEFIESNYRESKLYKYFTTKIQ